MTKRELKDQIEKLTRGGAVLLVENERLSGDAARHRDSARMEMERVRALIGHNERLEADLTNAIRWAKVLEKHIDPVLRDRLFEAFEEQARAPKMKVRVKAGSRRVAPAASPAPSMGEMLREIREAIGQPDGRPETDRGESK